MQQAQVGERLLPRSLLLPSGLGSPQVWSHVIACAYIVQNGLDLLLRDTHPTLNRVIPEQALGILSVWLEGKHFYVLQFPIGREQQEPTDNHEGIQTLLELVSNVMHANYCTAFEKGVLIYLTSARDVLIGNGDPAHNPYNTQLIVPAVPPFAPLVASDLKSQPRYKSFALKAKTLV